jgi:hypothetical protein
MDVPADVAAHARAQVEPIRETAADQLRDEREQTEREPRKESLVSPGRIHLTECAPRAGVRSNLDRTHVVRSGARRVSRLPPATV